MWRPEGWAYPDVAPSSVVVAHLDEHCNEKTCKDHRYGQITRLEEHDRGRYRDTVDPSGLAVYLIGREAQFEELVKPAHYQQEYEPVEDD